MEQSHRWLTIYLQDHHAASVAGVEFFHRVAGSHGDPKTRRVVADLASEIESDQGDLEEMMRSLKVPHSRSKEYLAWTGEKLGRIMTNGAVIRRSPLTDVVELEALSLAVEGKAQGWKVLLTLAETEPSAEPGLDQGQLQQLVDRAHEQRARLEELRLARATEIFGVGPSQAAGKS